MKYKLSECAKIIGGGTPKRSKKEYWDGNISWVTVKDFQGKFIEHTEERISKEGLKNSSVNVTENQDILISARGTVGKIAMVSCGYTFNQSIYGLRADKNLILPDFLYYWLLSNVSIIKQNTHGSVFSTITRDTFSHLEIEIPNLDEQRKVVNKINSFDRKIMLNNQINDNLLSLINFIYQKYCAKYTSSVKYSIKDIFDTYSKTFKIKESVSNKVWHFSIPNFDDNNEPKVELIANIKSNKHIVLPYSVLVSKLNPRLKRIWAPNLNNYPNYVPVCSPEFLTISGANTLQQSIILAIVNSPDFQRFINSNTTGTTGSRQRVKPQLAYSYQIPLNLNKLTALGKQCEPLLKKMQLNNSEIQNLVKIKKELINKYF